MTMTDPIADMLTRIRNANMARHKKVMFSHSKIKEKITQILKENGFIDRYEITGKDAKKEVVITLKYGTNKERVICGIEKVSRGGRRNYSKSKEIPSIQGGLGFAVLSTSKGILTDKEARKKNVGGEVICYIW